MAKATIRFDGGVRNHPDGGYVCCFGWVISRDARVIDRGCGFSRIDANPGSCAAEFEAMHAALSAGLSRGIVEDQVRIIGDNQSVIGMCAGDSTASSPSAIAGIHKVSSLSKRYSNAKFEWVPREKNAETDSLCYQAFRSALSDNGRGELMAKIHRKARMKFGRMYDAKLMGNWIQSVIGRGNLLRASTEELQVLLESVPLIPEFIAEFVARAAS